ncbi:hypothetical protein [Traorella massiliensis]|uniref:hypothetical protein n=1 Tax=Traorella massiliensis TaxID=1903263 RepID=UPI0023534C7F|nr:hypothetical protein [Traorella massiliensis]
MNRKLFEENKQIIYGFLLFLLGLVLIFISRNNSGSHFQDFVTGILMGLGVGVLFVGIVLILLSVFKKIRNE